MKYLEIQNVQTTLGCYLKQCLLVHAVTGANAYFADFEGIFCITISVGKRTLKSAEVILMVAFEEKKICDVKLHGHIFPPADF